MRRLLGWSLFLVVVWAAPSSAAVGTATPGVAAGDPAAVAQDDEAPTPGDDTGDNDSGEGDTPVDPPDDEDLPADDETEASDVEEREESVSAWWLIVGIIAGVAAVAGLVSGLRKRGVEEDWFAQAGSACDTGRAVVGSLTSSVADGSEWPPPVRFWTRLDRFSKQIEALSVSPPPGPATATTEQVCAAAADLRRALDNDLESPADTPSDAELGLSSHDLVEVALSDLKGALEGLERAVLLGGMGAGHPARRPPS